MVKARTFVGLLLVLFITTLAAPVPARAKSGEVEQYRFRGRVANAFFSSTDAEGCVETFGMLQAVDGRVVLAPENTTVDSLVSIFVEQYDYCEETEVTFVAGEAALPASAFQIDKRLQRATLNASFEVFDLHSETAVPVEIHTTWTGTGDPYRIKERFVYRSPTFRSNSRSDGTFRAANLSGTISIGGTDLPVESVEDAQIGSVKSATLVVSRENAP